MILYNFTKQYKIVSFFHFVQNSVLVFKEIANNLFKIANNLLDAPSTVSLCSTVTKNST